MDFRSARTALLWAAFAATGIAHLQAASLAVTLVDDAATLAAAVLGPAATIVGTPTLASTNFSSGPYTQTGGLSGMYSLSSGIIFTTNAGVSSYNVNEGDGALSVITGSAKNGQTDGCWIVITNDQRYAYAANFISGTISSYSLGADGSVAFIDGAAVFQGLTSQPTDLAFSGDSRYLYNLLRGTGGIAAFRVQANGSLTSLGFFGVAGGLPVADGASGLAAY